VVTLLHATQGQGHSLSVAWTSRDSRADGNGLIAIASSDTFCQTIWIWCPTNRTTKSRHIQSANMPFSVVELKGESYIASRRFDIKEGPRPVRGRAGRLKYGDCPAFARGTTGSRRRIDDQEYKNG